MRSQDETKNSCFELTDQAIEGADVNSQQKITVEGGGTPVRSCTVMKNESAPPILPIDLLRKHGGKTGEELKAEGK